MLRRLGLLIFIILMSVSVTSAQRLCEALVTNALEQAEQNCTEQDGELVCYAYDNLSATFYETDTNPFFAPSNIVDIPTVQTVQSSPIDLEEDEWGIAYVQLQSNLPEATKDSSLRMIMLGEVFLENAVNEEIGGSVDSLLITVNSITNLFEAPDKASPMVADVNAGTVYGAVGQSTDGEWLAVINSGNIAWVSRELVTSEADLSLLPDVESMGLTGGSDEVRTAFDDLYFETGGESDCQEAPNMLFVQGPDGQSVDVTLNNVPIRIGSTISLGTDFVDGEPVMWVTVISGDAILYPDTPDAVQLQPFEVSYAPISSVIGGATVPVINFLTGEPVLKPNGEPFLRRIPSAGFSEPIPITEDGIGFMGYGYYEIIHLLPHNWLNYVLPTLPLFVEATPVAQQSATTGNNLIQPPPAEIEEPPVPVIVDACNPEPQNFCFPGQPWGDGRCDTADPNLTAYYYQAGWYNAALACGTIDSLPPQYNPNASDNTSGTLTVNCGGRVGAFTQRFSADWSEPVEGQAEAVWFYVAVIGSDLENYRARQDVSSGATSASVSTDENLSDASSFENIRFVLLDSNGEQLISRVQCD